MFLIKKNKEYKIKDFVKVTDYSDIYIKKILRLLNEKGYIKRVGSNKKGYWEVLK